MGFDLKYVCKNTNQSGSGEEEHVDGLVNEPQ